eukprot:10002025-Alexandrium_andersonii.AAC.1
MRSTPGPTDAVALPAVAVGEAEQAFRNMVLRKYLENKASAYEIKVEVGKATRAGARGAEDLAPQVRLGNAQRSLMRACLKGCEAPPVYSMRLPVHTPGGGPKDNTWVDFPLLLPHE